MSYRKAPTVETLSFSTLQYEHEIDKLLPLIRALDDQSMNPQGQDPRIQAFADGIVQKIYNPYEGEFRKVIADYLLDEAAPGYVDPEHSVMKLVRAIQAPLLKEREKWQYPESFLEPSRWSEAVDWIMADPVRFSLFGYDLYVRHVSSNVAQRYVTVPLLTGLLRLQDEDRFQEPLRIGDFGSSMGLGLDKLVADSPFGELRWVNTSPDQEQQLEGLVENYVVGESVGVDLVDFKDPHANWWAMSGSGYPSEWLNSDLLAEFKHVKHDASKHNKVSLREADFSNRESLLKAGLEPGSLDVVIMSSSYYELRPPMRKPARQNALYFAKPEGVVVVLDFAFINKMGALMLYRKKFDKPYKYRAIVTDKTRPETGSTEFFVYKNGRCKDVQLGVGAQAVLRSVTE